MDTLFNLLYDRKMECGLPNEDMQEKAGEIVAYEN